jgi:hypothetical protein
VSTNPDYKDKIEMKVNPLTKAAIGLTAAAAAYVLVQKKRHALDSEAPVRAEIHGRETWR